MSDYGLGARVARQDVLEEALRIKLIELVSQFKDDYQATLDHVTSGDSITVAAALLPVIEECVGDESGLDYLAEMLGVTVQDVRSAPDGFVYVLKADKYYKIGRAKKLTQRIKTLKIQLPFETKVWHAFPCESYVEAERYLHEHFGHYRVNGEWFELSDSAVDWLATCQYMTVPRGEFSHIGRSRSEPHDYIPAAIRADKQWGEALVQALAAREARDQ